MYSFGVFQNSADSCRVEFWTIISKQCLRVEIEAFFLNKLPVNHNLDKMKILKQVEYESARRKSNINEKQEKEMRKALHFFYVHLSFFIL